MDLPERIDETAFVEAVEGRSSLLFPDEKQQARFELGVSMMIYKWNALDVAVVNQWGGPESAEKRDWVTSIIVDLFKTEKIVDVELIEETLVYAMFDEFDTNVEDESALPIAAAIIIIYRECAQENYSTVERLYLNWMENKDKNDASKLVVAESSDDEEVDEEAGADEDDVNMDEDVPQLVNSEHQISAPEPVLDEDGFELVQKKGKRRY
ncbi:Tsr2p [Kluyveromyces lactis]|uniref:KLLA0B05467p n=1 Tax=Kluyveromyces lactis (strain ATCC 8585 / CBS 2359 / DSM 70799 / NBRC 1267 / NRRL Y-1140 / WM37) TaxID=284590 RepID=Q6CWB0_KLULA|nr:uncharacterized protein KLLA0_B05467g [Kluyveromyces lactis]CAH02172.1 KLLA0B05467p [Kluyveromyces lactis]|eukprot:XP_451779.1 uncharacterized protein KLLA0_B05467g [Kluyveromyces lactis]